MLQRFAAIIFIAPALMSIPCPATVKQGPQSPSLQSDKQRLADSESRAVQSVIDRAEHHYKLGELCLKDRNYAAARGEFDKAVDAVLESGIDVRSNPRLQTYYLSLVERVYRMELLPPRRGRGSSPGLARAKTRWPSPAYCATRSSIPRRSMIWPGSISPRRRGRFRRRRGGTPKSVGRRH